MTTHVMDDVARRHDLDGLRGVAVLLTIFLHYVSQRGYFSYLGPAPVTFFLDYFWCGVDIFFVLSGFLIGGIILDKGRSENFFRVFYLRRSLRILPVALVTIAIAYLVIPLLSPYATSQTGVPPYAYLLFINNFWTAIGFQPYSPLGPMWSLAIEEQFYLIAPALMLLAGARSRNFVLVGVVVASPLLRLWELPVSSWDFTFFRLDGLAAGMLVAVIVRDERSQLFITRHKRRITMVVAGLATATLMFAFFLSASGRERIAWAISLNSLTAAAVVLFLHLNPTSSLSRMLSRSWLVATGRWSYFLYLMHLPILACLVAIQGRSGPLQLLLAFAICVLFAWASWRFLESRLIAIGKRFSYQAHASSGATLPGASVRSIMQRNAGPMQ